MSDPYRSASTEGCPECATPLLAPDEHGVRACANNCGQWAASPVIDRRWGPAMAIRDDPRLRWRGKPPFACVVCRAPTRRRMQEQCTYYVCDEHGVWFHRDSLARFESLFAPTISAYRAGLARIDAMAALLGRVRDGDAAAIGELARRWVALERRVHEVTRRTVAIGTSVGVSVAELLDDD